MTTTDHHTPATDLARPGTSGQETAIAAAERLLADTASAITPSTPAPVLLACLTRYRAHLSALAAATRATTPAARAQATR